MTAEGPAPIEPIRSIDVDLTITYEGATMAIYTGTDRLIVEVGSFRALRTVRSGLSSIDGTESPVPEIGSVLPIELRVRGVTIGTIGGRTDRRSVRIPRGGLSIAPGGVLIAAIRRFTKQQR